MVRCLIVTWDGAGNLGPTLGIAQALVEAGHDVRLLGHDTIAERCGPLPARFVPLSQGRGWDAMAAPDDFDAEVALLINQLCFNQGTAQDLASELAREPADVLLVDCMLYAALNVAEASGVPTATLFHAPYAIFRDGPLMEMLSPGVAITNGQRVELGLAPVGHLSEIHDACALALVAAPSEFEPPVPQADNVVRIGPVLDGPPLLPTSDEVDVSDGTTPLVLVSLSTSEQGQANLLQRCADAVAGMPVRAVITTGPSIAPEAVRAGANTQVVSFVPHAELLPSTSLVITHAGLGTTMAALGAGVPMVCVPMGRDQFFNAEQVERLGAGRALPPDAPAERIAETALEVLGDAATRAAAKQLAMTIAAAGGAREAVSRLERLGTGGKA
jgi:MGT family glycosyltransferase